ASAALNAVLASAPDTPVLAAACAPASAALAGLGRLVDVVTQGAMDETERGFIDDLVRPGGLAEMGFDPAGAISLLLWQIPQDPVGIVGLPFAGDADAAQAVLARMSGKKPNRLDAPGRWLLPSEDGPDMRVSLHDGRLDLSFNGLPPPGAAGIPALDPPLVAGLPAQAGCAIWAAMPAKAIPRTVKIKREDGLAVAAFVPFGHGGLAHIRVRPGGSLPSVFSTAHAAPVSGSSVDAPALVLSLGMGVGDLLGDDVLAKAMHLSTGQSRRAQRWLNIGPGATIAAFGKPRDLDLVALLPLDGQRGPTAQKKVLRRLVRLAAKTDLTVLSQDDQGLVIDVKPTPLRVEVRDGRIAVGSSAARVLQAVEGQGQPWVTAQDAAWAMQWPIAVWTAGGGRTVGPVSVSVRMGMRADQDIVDLGLKVKTDADPDLIGQMAARILDGIASRAGKARTSSGETDTASGDVERTMEGIARAQEVQLSAHGSYLALPAAPRSAQEADPEAVAWQMAGDWASLGWTPDPSTTAAVYWVEIGDDGTSYTVHAETDLDGDGQRAHYVRTSQAPVRRTTPDGVR
ncbi:MAG: hypothetical protein GXP62_09945, partial [Oligoflexia bacterium]|nr:hypothetical protein [Oligoflexia bacterium]